MRQPHRCLEQRTTDHARKGERERERRRRRSRSRVVKSDRL